MSLFLEASIEILVSPYLPHLVPTCLNMANNNGFWTDRMIELLIHKVRSYNALYDYTLREYMDPEIKHNAFREIGEQLDGLDHVEVEAQWKRIKKKFQDARTADRRARRSGAALDEDQTTSRWIHMKNMMWLEKHIKTRNRTSRVTNAPNVKKTPESTTVRGPTAGHTEAPRPSSDSAPPQRPAVSTSNNSQTPHFSSDEEAVMTNDNPPRFVITQKAVDVSHSDNEENDDAAKKDEHQQPINADQLFCNEGTRDVALPGGPGTRDVALPGGPGTRDLVLPGGSGTRDLALSGGSGTRDLALPGGSSGNGESSTCMNASHSSTNSSSDISPYYAAKSRSQEVCPSAPKKKREHEPIAPLLSKMDNLMDKYQQSRQVTTPTSTTKHWTDSFGADCGSRLAKLPRRKSLELRKNIESLILDAEFDLLVEEDKEN